MGGGAGADRRTHIRSNQPMARIATAVKPKYHGQERTWRANPHRPAARTAATRRAPPGIQERREGTGLMRPDLLYSRVPQTAAPSWASVPSLTGTATASMSGERIRSVS